MKRAYHLVKTLLFHLAPLESFLGNLDLDANSRVTKSNMVLENQPGIICFLAVDNLVLIIRKLTQSLFLTRGTT